MASARLPMPRERTDFDFSVSPVNELPIRVLAAGGFLEDRRNLVLVGSSGAGKTHLSLAILQVDGYAGYYNRLTGPGCKGGAPLRFAYRRVHCRRRLREFYDCSNSEIAEEGLRRIADLFYAINACIRGSARLVRPCGDRVEMVSNNVENFGRPIALSRKNALFAGHDEGAAAWGLIALLIETAKSNGVDSYAWLKATLEAVAAGHPNSRIVEPPPCNFKPAST